MAELPARESMDFDVVVVGAGPAGLATAIRLKQVAARDGRRALGRRRREGLGGRRAHPLRRGRSTRSASTGSLPEWRSDPDRPLKTEVERGRVPLSRPRRAACACRTCSMPKLMNNHGNFVGSLGNVARYLGRKAEEARRRDLSGLSGRRGPRRGWPRRRRRDRRHGHRPRRRAAAPTSPAAWSCAPSTRSSAKARAAA